MADFSVLILDDDEMWVARHERRLTQAMFKCRSTQWAKEAVNIAKTDPSIKHALIDEILYVPPIPIDEENWELQGKQGSSVVREITAYRSDVQIIIVTAAPELRSGGDTRILTRQTAMLRRQPGVVNIIHKQDIEDNPDREYGWLIDLLKKPKSSESGQVLMQRILIGFGFEREIYEAMTQQAKSPKVNWLPLEALSAKIGPERALEEFWERAKEKSVFIEMPGSKRIDRCSNIRPDSQGFNILMLLAGRAEKHEDVVISEEDYKGFAKYRRRGAGMGANASPDVDPRSVRDFLYEYDEEDRISLRPGVHVEGGTGRGSTLRVAIHRLSQKLAELNVGPRRHLFQGFEQSRYRPSFKVGVVLYPSDLTRRRG